MQIPLSLVHYKQSARDQGCHRQTQGDVRMSHGHQSTQFDEGRLMASVGLTRGV